MAKRSDGPTTATIYWITHPAKPGDIYIGKTVLPFSKRARAHTRAKGSAGPRLRNWWNARIKQTGIEPEVKVLECRDFDSRAEADAWASEREMEYIATVRASAANEGSTVRCLNSTAGGEGCKEPVAETRARTSHSLKAALACLTKEQRRDWMQRAIAASAARPPEARQAAAEKAIAARTHEQRSTAARTWQAAKTPEQRSEYARRAAAALTPEQRSERSRKGNASVPAEQRSERSRRRHARTTPAQRSATADKAWATRRANKAAREAALRAEPAEAVGPAATRPPVSQPDAPAPLEPPPLAAGCEPSSPSEAPATAVPARSTTLDPQP